MKQKSKKLLIVRDYLVISLGLLMYIFGWTGFILSHEITTGGLAGIASLFKFSTGIEASIPYNIINFFLLGLALKILGWRFSVKTVFSVLMLGITIPFFEAFFKVPLLADEPFMAVVIGAILCGSGLGIVFSVNGSTGGTDIIAAIINKYKNISIGRALVFIDFIIIGCSYFIFHDPNKLVFSLVEVVICSFTLDYILNSNRQSVQFLIFSQQGAAINRRIINELKRGTTFLKATGGFSGEDREVLVVMVRKPEAMNVIRIVKDEDPDAFISQSIVKGVYGQGFERMRS